MTQWKQHGFEDEMWSDKGLNIWRHVEEELSVEGEDQRQVRHGSHHAGHINVQISLCKLANLVQGML